MRQMLRSVSEALAAKLQAIRTDYDLRVEEQEKLREAAAAANPSKAQALPPGSVDAKWLADKNRAQAKTLLKQSVALGLEQARNLARQAAGESLTQSLVALENGSTDAAEGLEDEALQWQWFFLLRKWERLGIPKDLSELMTVNASRRLPHPCNSIQP